MEQYYCNVCYSKLSEESGCGSVSYFCPKCKRLVSRSKMLTEDQLKDQGERDPK